MTRKNNITTIIVIAFLFRFILLLIDNYWFNLPQSGTDTVRFDRTAYNMSISPSIPFLDVISNGAHLHIWIGSLLYSIFGRAPMLWGFIMVLLGTGTVYNIHRGVFLISNNNILANRSAWMAALFPNFAVLSATILREAPIYFFISLAILFMIKYIKEKSIPSLVLFFVFGLIGSVFHSGVFALFFGFLFYIVLLNKNTKFVLKIFVVFIGVIGLYFINQTGIGLSKFGGSFEGAVDSLTESQDLAEHANTNYPAWLQLSGGIGDLFLIPFRFIAFLFAPFIPFLAKSGTHLIGVFDGVLYFIIILQVFLARKIIIKNEMVKAIVVIAITLSIAFSFGASNFGTNIRHRAKILPILLMLPLLSKKDRQYAYYLNYKKSKS